MQAIYRAVSVHQMAQSLTLPSSNAATVQSHALHLPV